jgi:hypothetical protein
MHKPFVVSEKKKKVSCGDDRVHAYSAQWCTAFSLLNVQNTEETKSRVQSVVVHDEEGNQKAKEVVSCR